MQASTSEKIVAYVAIVLSVCAVGISLAEVWTMRRQSKAEVWTYIHLGWVADTPGFSSPLQENWKIDENKGGFALLLPNQGVGPGIVENMFLWVDGKPVKNWPDAFAAIGLRKQTLFSNSRVRNRVLPPGDSKVAFITQDSAAALAFVKQRARIELGLCFRSVYGDRWFQKRDMTDTYLQYQACDECPWPDSLSMQPEGKVSADTLRSQ
jgi:hypothetical protein